MSFRADHGKFAVMWFAEVADALLFLWVNSRTVFPEVLVIADDIRLCPFWGILSRGMVAQCDDNGIDSGIPDTSIRAVVVYFGFPISGFNFCRVKPRVQFRDEDLHKARNIRCHQVAGGTLVEHILSSEEYEDRFGDKLTIAVFVVGHLFRAVGLDLFRVKTGVQFRVKEFHEITALADSDNSHIGSFLPAGSAPVGLSIIYLQRVKVYGSC